MVLDYSGRRPAPPQKNRPHKQPVGIFVLILISAVSMSFALGIRTGWFVFRPAGKAVRSQEVRTAAAKAAETPAAQPPYQNPEAAGAKGDPPLTFYETLPKGGKAVIGSGLNPPKADERQPPKAAVTAPAPAPQPATSQPAVPPVAAKPEEPKVQAKAPVEQGKKPEKADAAASRKEPATGKYFVQVASTQERSEAESLKTKLAAKGLPAYVVESSIKDRGTWFRVRVGKHLSQQAAGEMAAKAGKGAMAISE